MNPLRALVPAPLRPAARQARSLVRRLLPTEHAAPLPADTCRAAVTVERAVPPAEAGRTFDVLLAVTNHTPQVLAPGGRHPVGVRVAWRRLHRRAVRRGGRLRTAAAPALARRDAHPPVPVRRAGVAGRLRRRVRGGAAGRPGVRAGRPPGQSSTCR